MCEKRLFHILVLLHLHQTKSSIFIVSMVSNKLFHHYNYFIAIIVCIFFLSSRSLFLFPFHFSLYSHVHLSILAHVFIRLRCVQLLAIYISLTCTLIHALLSSFIQPIESTAGPKPLTIIKIMRKRTVIMQKATTKIQPNKLYCGVYCVRVYGKCFGICVSMPISRDDIYTDSNLIMQCIQRAPLIPVGRWNVHT